MKIGIILDFVCPYCFVETELLWKFLGDDWDKKKNRMVPL